MKKTVLLVVVLFLISLTGFAQTRVTSRAPVDHNQEGGADVPNSGFGIKGGVNFNHIRGNDKPSGAEGLTAYHAGGYAQLAVTRVFSVQLEALYSRKGYKLDSTMKYNYIDVPVLAVVNLTDNLSLHAGPQASIMIKAVEGGKEKNMDRYNTFGYAAVGGAEARFGIARLGARYVLGFEDLRKENDLGQKITEDLKKGIFQVYVGIGF